MLKEKAFNFLQWIAITNSKFNYNTGRLDHVLFKQVLTWQEHALSGYLNQFMSTFLTCNYNVICNLVTFL